MNNSLEIIQQVIQRDLEWAQAHINLNLDIIEKILAEDFQQRQPDGSFIGKIDLLTSYASGERFWEIAESTNHHVQLANDLAIIIGCWHGKGINTGERFDYTARFLSIYRQEDENWKMVQEVSLSVC